MGRGRKKAVKSSEPDALALSIHGNGDSAPSSSNNNGGHPIIASPLQASPPHNTSLQIPLLTDGTGEDNAAAVAAAADASASQPAKLGEDYFEIETLRRKRVRKGQIQYLVKWQGWPETANTWEPSDNLKDCSEFIEEFEKRMEISRSGKQRKRKRTDGDSDNQPHERKHHHGLATDIVTEVNISSVDDRLLAAPLDSKLHCDLPIGSVDVENGHMDEKFKGSRKGDEYDLKLIELKDKTAEASKDLGLIHDDSNADCGLGSTQGSHSIGAKRRKSSRVKRFTKDAILSENSGQGSKQNGVTGSIEPTDRNEQSGSKNPSLRNVSTITKIIKPVGYSFSVSNNIPDIVVTFSALSSDGKEVTVNNKFLKVHNPLLLISFYEQHLRYNPTL